MSRYNLRSHLRSHGELPPPDEIELDDNNNDDDSTDTDDVSESDAIEDDPFYEPYLENETLMNIGRIVRYELVRHEGGGGIGGDFGDYDDESDNDDEPPVNTRVVSESESLPPPPPVPVVSEPEEQCSSHLSSDPTLLGPNDFEGLPRYRMAFMCVRYFEFTGIRNIAVASSIPNEQLVRALCQIPRGRVVPDCSICSYPLWDGLQTRCCGQSLCIHCVNRCAECPYCRAAEY